MAAQKKKETGKRVRRRLPAKPFPGVALEKALQVAFKIKELNGGNPWRPDDIAAAVESSPKSSDFYYLTAAARDYGVTSGTRDTEAIALTELGRAIAYAPDPLTERKYKIEAFHKIDLFGKVLAHYKGANLPESQTFPSQSQKLSLIVFGL